jgi:aromatic-L-amino-acid decarboxylase
VPFRHAPAGVPLDVHNQRLADAIQADGRIYLASALVDGEVWLRPCFVNFRTTDEDVEAILDVARELGAGLISGAA